MARYDIFRLAEGVLVVDCQADLLDALATRVVVPLVPHDRAPPAAKRLNPVFPILGKDHVLLVQSISAVELRELGQSIGSLSDHAFEVGNALDMLFSGF